MAHRERWERLSEVYSAVVRLPPQERPALLENICGSDHEMRRELEQMLACEPQEGILDRPNEMHAALRSITGTDAPALKPGILLASRFHIVRFIGAGGMGEVYEARDVDLDESVALKVLRRGVGADKATIARFKREIQLSRRITHPNVCRVFDISRHQIGPREDDVILFLTMELLDGETLADRLHRDGALPPKEAVVMIQQVTDGLQAAHEAGVIHRDLKSSNIMLVKTSEGGTRAVVTDFGIARSAVCAGDEPAGELLYLVGTLPYVAPEQIKRGESTPASDIYALGIVIHEAYTGGHPVGRESLTKILSAPDGEPPKVHPALRGLSGQVARVILRCLESEPARRFQSAQEVRDQLSPRPKMSRRSLVAIAGTGLAACSLSIWTYADRQRTRRGGTRVREADVAYQKGRLHVRRMTLDDAQKAISYFRQAIKLDPGFALAYSGLADSYSVLADYGGMPQREAILEAQKAASESLRLAPELADAHASVGLALSNDVRNWRKAETHFMKAIQLNPQNAAARQWHAAFLARLGRTEEAIREMQEAVAADPVSLPVSVVLGWMYYFDRKYEAAIEQGLRTVDLDPNFRYGYLLLARAYAALGNFDGARKACSRGTLLSGDAPVFASALACVHAASNHGAQALDVARLLEKRRENEYLPALYIATIYGLLGRAEDAFNWLRRGFDEGDTPVLMVRVYPQFDSIRTDKRYDSVLTDFDLR